MIINTNIKVFSASFSSLKRNDNKHAPNKITLNHNPDNGTEKLKRVSVSDLSAKGISINNLKNKDIFDLTCILHKKIQSQLQPATEKEVNEIISAIEKKGAAKNEALYALYILTQFGNMNSLVKLGQVFKSMDIGIFNREAGLCTNQALDYIYNSKKITPVGIKNTAYILDEHSLEFLENNPDKLKRYKNFPNMHFINLEGWNNGINIYNQGKDNDYIINSAITHIKHARNLQSENDISFEQAFKESVNGDIIKRAEKLGINPEIVSLDNGKTPDTREIVRNLAPYNISYKHLFNIINSTGDTLFTDKKQAQRCKMILAKYFNSEVEVYSPKRLGKRLKEIHEQVLNYAAGAVKSDGKPYTEEDITYLIPSTRKSFDQIGLQYAEVNDIDLNNFVHSYEKNFEIYPDDTIYVVLDDIVATGNSILIEGLGYAMSYHKKNMGDFRHILIAPVMSMKSGYKSIKDEIKESGRLNLDEIITEPKSENISLKTSQFYSSLSKSDKNIFDIMISKINSYEHGSYEGEEGAVLFPYMGPDTNSVISSLLFERLVPNINMLKSRYDENNNTAKMIKANIAKAERQEKIKN